MNCCWETTYISIDIDISIYLQRTKHKIFFKELKVEWKDVKSKEEESLWLWLVTLVFSEEMEFRQVTKICKERDVAFQKDNYMGNLKDIYIWPGSAYFTCCTYFYMPKISYHWDKVMWIPAQVEPHFSKPLKSVWELTGISPQYLLLTHPCLWGTRVVLLANWGSRWQMSYLAAGVWTELIVEYKKVS